MKKNAFTLIELIAAIGLLGMLATITITVSVKKLNETKEKSRETMISSIELAAKQYVIDNENELTEYKNNDFIYITLQTLVEKEYFTSSLKDPTTDKTLPLSDTVYVTRDKNGYVKSEYDINQREKATIILNGAYNEYIKKGSTYNELGVTAKKNNENITNEVVITHKIDTSITGTYKVTYEYEDKTITRNVIVYEEKNESTSNYSYISSYITNLYRNVKTREENGLIMDNTKDKNIRYAGSNEDVKNYVEFNGETWRIIGVFEVETSNGKKEKLTKIVRDEKLLNASWDSSDSTINGGFGINQWGASGTYEGADLMRLLNGYYLGKETTCSYCNGSSQATCSNDCTSSVTPISTESLNMIENVVWKTGAQEYLDSIDVETFYNSERCRQIGKICTSGSYHCNDTVERTTEWEGKIGLIYPSDYGYASTDESCANNILYSSSTCENDNWLHSTSGYYWTLSPRANFDDADYVWRVGYNDSICADAVLLSYAVHPSLYLKSSVKITGEGTNDENIYKLIME